METGLPVDGVRLMPTIGKLKLRTFTPVGGVSKSVMLTVASPVVQFVVHLVLEPLQEARGRTTRKIRRSNGRFEFIQTPQGDLATAPNGFGRQKSPRSHCNPGAGTELRGNNRSAQVLNEGRTRAVSQGACQPMIS